MAAKRIDIMELKQLLLLKSKGESNRSCERLLGIHRNTINYYVRMFRASGLPYAKLLEYTDKNPPLFALIPFLRYFAPIWGK